MRTDEHELPALLTPAEVQARLRISRASFYRYVSRGELEHVRLGGRDSAAIRVPVPALERFMRAGPACNPEEVPR